LSSDAFPRLVVDGKLTSGGFPQLAVDGNLTQRMYDRILMCSHTSSTNTSWEVDIGALCSVDHVIIYNRLDPGCGR